MSVRSLFLLVMSAVAAASSTAIFKFTLQGRFVWKGSLFRLWRDAFELFGVPGFWLGLLIFFIANVLWLLVLGSVRMSVAYPFQIALVLLLNTSISVLVFKESVSIYGYFGLGCIMAGVVLISR